MRPIVLLLPLCFIAGLLFERRRTRRVELSLRGSEDRYRSVVEAQSELICRYLPDTTLTFVNAAYCRYFGRTRDDLIGSKFVDLIPVTARADALHHLDALLRAPQPALYEHEVIRRDGSIGWQQWVDNVIFDSHGRVFEVQGIGRDVTELREAQHTLEQQQRELTHLTRVAMLGEISGALAHELNQPLTSILSNTQAAIRLLEHERFDVAEVRDILADVVDQDQHAGSFIRRLRELLKRGDTSLHPLDLNSLITSVVELIRGELFTTGISLRQQLDPALPAVLADSVQLQQVLLNLLLNARDAMSATPRAQRRIEIRTALDDAGAITLSISDRGCGIPVMDLGRVFESFYTTKPDGLGLGLAICRTIVLAHGGRLWATNNEGLGATVHVVLQPERKVREPGSSPAAIETAIGPKSTTRGEHSV